MRLLRDRRLATLLVAEAISSTGTQMTWVALPWFVLRTTGSPQRMTWVIIAEILPVAVLGFWGGAICLHMSKGEPFVIPSVFLLLTWAGAYLRVPGTFASFAVSSLTEWPVANAANVAKELVV